MERERVGVLESDRLGLNSSCFTYLLDQFEQHFKSFYPQFLHVFFKKDNNSYLINLSLDRMMLKLKLQYFGHLMPRADSLEKTLRLGGLGAGSEGDGRG